MYAFRQVFPRMCFGHFFVYTCTTTLLVHKGDVRIDSYTTEGTSAVLYRLSQPNRHMAPLQGLRSHPVELEAAANKEIICLYSLAGRAPTQ